ncbi:MAG: hypothetical protein LBR43_00955 [Spiroplasmataceae bacterium]|nr:hypothetical protein [Spiroplasmataceae bacterium]
MFWYWPDSLGLLGFGWPSVFFCPAVNYTITTNSTTSSANHLVDNKLALTISLLSTLGILNY